MKKFFKLTLKKRAVKWPVVGLVSAFFILGSVFAANYVFAVHTATVTVNPEVIKGGVSNAYAFNLTNSGGSDNYIYLVKITAPAGFDIDDNLICPASWTSAFIDTEITCTGDPDPAIGLGIQPGASASISFVALSPSSDSTAPWVVQTKDNVFGTQTYNPTTRVDATPPTIESITTKDNDGDGKVETATIIFSEPVDDSTFVPANFTLGGVAANSIDSDTADDNSFDIVVTAGVDGTEAKDVTYTQGIGAALVGNSLANVGAGDEAEVDAAKPVFMSARTQSPTTINLNFSENINSATKNDFAVGANVETNNIDHASTAGNIVTLTLITPIGTGDTPDIYYDKTWSAGVKDEVLNVSDTVMRSSTDGIAPVLISSRTITTSTIQITFSEQMGTAQNTDFAVEGNTVTNAVLDAGAASATLTLGTPITTDATPLVSIIGAPTGTADDASPINMITGGQTSTPVDGISPTVAITSTVAAVTNVSTFPMTVTFSEIVTGFDAADLLITNGTAGNFAGAGAVYTFDLTPGGQGLVVVNIIGNAAQDAVSNPNVAATQFSATYDSVSPTTPTVLSLSGGQYVKGGADYNITWTPVLDANLGLTPINIEYSALGTFTDTVALASDQTNGGTYIWSVPSSNLATAKIRITATDLAGNSSNDESNTNFIIDSIAPAIETGTLLTPSAAGLNFKGGQSYEITWTSADIVDTNIGSNPITLQYSALGDFSDAINLETNGANDGTYSWTVPTADLNTAKIKVIATDLAGNSSNDVSNNSFRIDSIPPAVNAGSDVIENVLFTQDATVSDGGSGIATYAWTKLSGAGTISFGSAGAEDTTVTANTDGIYVIRLTVTDNAGNSAYDEFSLLWDTANPTVALTKDHDDLIVRDEDKVEITATFNEPMAAPTVSINLTGGDADITNAPMSGDGTTWNYIWEVPGGHDGSALVTVAGVDLAGNAYVEGTNIIFTIDNIDPTPVIESAPVVSPTNNTTPNNGITVENGASWEISNDDTELLEGTGTGALQTVTLPVLTEGTYSLELEATDVAGNETSIELTDFIIDTATPIVAISAPTANQVIKSADITLTSSATDTLGVTCQYRVDGGAAADIDCENGTITGLTDGRHTITLIATDAATNSSSAEVQVVIDLNNTLTVNGAGGADFTTIQEAVTKSTASDAINIAAGTYSEAVTIDKRLTLAGTGAPTATSFTLNSGADISGSNGITAGTVNVNGAKIAEGILLASSGGTVNVGAGTYNENLTITQALTLNGANTGVDPITGARGAETILNAPGATAINVLVAGVTIDGFSINASMGVYAEAATSVENFTVRNNIITGTVRSVSLGGGGGANTQITRNDLISTSRSLHLSGSGTYTNLKVNNNRFSGAADTGIQFLGNVPINGFEFKDNNVQHLANLGSTITDGLVSGNRFETVGASDLGLQINLHNSTLTDNVFEGNTTGACLQLFGSQYGLPASDNITVSGNTFNNCGANAASWNFAIQLSQDIEDITITNNTITNAYEAVNTRIGTDSSPASWDMTGKDIHFNNNSISGSRHLAVNNTVTGILDASSNWWGNSSGPAHASNTGATGDGVSDNVSFRPWRISDDLEDSVDSTSPTVIVSSTATSPTNDAPIPVSIVFNEAVSDLTEGEITVTNGSVAAGSLAGSGTSYTFNVTPAGQGAVTVTVTASSAWDLSGNFNTVSNIFSITYDTGAPLAPVITHIATDERINNAEKAAIVVTGTAEANSLVSVTLSGGATDSGTQQLSGGATDFSITIDGTALTDGIITPSVTATDAAGNVSPAAATPTAVKDIIAPTAAETTPVLALTNDSTPNAVITVEAGATWVITDGIDDFASGIGTGAAQIVTLSPLADDTYNLDLVATDAAGNTTIVSLTAFVVDLTDPAIILESMFTGQTLVGGSVTTIEWTVTDDHLGATPIKLEYSLNGGTDWALIVNATANDGIENWTVPSNNRSDCFVRITANDSAGNEDFELSSSFAISHSVVVDSSAPEAALNSPNGGETWESGTTSTITWTADDNLTADPNIDIKLEYSLNGGTSWVTITEDTENDGAYSWAIPAGISSTNALVKVTAEDAANLTDSDISNAVFNIAIPVAYPEPICGAPVAGIYTCNIALSSGWNLISLPVIPTSSAIADVLAGKTGAGVIDTVQYYDDGDWVPYHPATASGDLTTMQDGKGYWVNVTGGAANLAVTGTAAPAAPNPLPSYQVIPGWNLIGFKSTSAYVTTTTYLSTAPAGYIVLDQANVNKNGSYLSGGKGYWLWSNSEGTIVPTEAGD